MNSDENIKSENEKSVSDKDTKKEPVEKNFCQIEGWWSLDESDQMYVDMADELDL